MTNRTRIDQLHLRVPGLSREQAANLGAAVAKQLAGQLPASMRGRNLNSVRVQLAIPVGTPRACLASIITAGIAKKIS